MLLKIYLVNILEGQNITIEMIGVFNGVTAGIRNRRNSNLAKPVLSLNFFSAVPSGLSGNGATGVAQKLDMSFQSFTSPNIRRTDRGALFEPAATNFAFPTNLIPGSGWSLSSSFSAQNAKTSILAAQGGQAFEFVSNGTIAILTASNLGTWDNTKVYTLSYCFEMTGTTANTYLVAEDSTANNSVLNISGGNLNTTSPSTGTAAVASTGQIWTFLNQGIGPNGGTLWLMSTSGTPTTNGGTIRIRLRANGPSTPAVGASIIPHYFQLEANPAPTSPIYNATTSATSRLAESITTAVPNGTYNVRYALQDGTVIDRLGTVISDGNLHIPTDLYQHPPLDSVTPPTPTNQRIGYVTKIEVWNPITNLYLVGDSFAGQPTNVWLPSKLTVPRVFAFNTLSGASLSQEADNFDAATTHWGDVLIIMDGGLTNGETPTTYLAGVARMVARLTLNPKKWIFVQTFPTGQVAGNERGGTFYTNYQACMDAVQAAYPNNFVPTLSLMQQLGSDGSANDLSDISVGWICRSCQVDGLHPNNKGSQILNTIIASALYLKNF